MKLIVPQCIVLPYPLKAGHKLMKVAEGTQFKTKSFCKQYTTFLVDISADRGFIPARLAVVTSVIGQDRCHWHLETSINLDLQNEKFGKCFQNQLSAAYQGVTFVENTNDMQINEIKRDRIMKT